MCAEQRRPRSSALAQECKHKQFQIGMENTASHNQILSKKVNQCPKIYKGLQRTSTRWIAAAATPQVIKVITLPVVKVIICIVIIIFLLYIVIFFCSL